MANLNTALTPAPVVTVLNKDGSTATGYTGNVTMALGTNPTAATLGGTVTVAASSGVATFSNLTLNRSGKDFTLLATAAAQGGYTPRARVSRPFSIPTRCVFTTQPVGVAAAGDILPTFTVTIQDSAGNTDTAYNGEITVALYTGAGSGILGGFTTRLATAGVADFSGLSIDANGTYSLRATAESVSTAYDPAPAISNTFTIPLNTLVPADIGGFGSSYGYVFSPPSGSLSDRNAVTGFPVLSITQLQIGPLYSLEVALQGATSQSAFTSITIIRPSGVSFTFYTALADSWNGAGTWAWDSGTLAINSFGVNYTVLFA